MQTEETLRLGALGGDHAAPRARARVSTVGVAPLGGTEVDVVLSSYLAGLSSRWPSLEFPGFHEGAAHTANFLAVLQDPGPKVAETRVCCPLTNPDVTSWRQLVAMAAAGVRIERVVFWNIYPAYGSYRRRVRPWAAEIERLVVLMPRLKAVLACGKEAQKGLKHVRLPAGVRLIEAPHPSPKACISNPNATADLHRTWAHAGAEGG
jgi:hypothetical protein